MKKLNVNKKKFKKVLSIIKFILFITMLILIYLVSPRITQVIQNIAKYLYDMESDYITRVVQLIMTVSFSLAVATTFKKEK